jgi:hypothetical protein
MLIDFTVFDVEDILGFLEDKEELTTNFEEALKLIEEDLK